MRDESTGTEVDLFGEQIMRASEKRLDWGSRRLQNWRARKTLEGEGFNILDLMAMTISEALGKGDYETAHARIMDAAPYFAVKLGGAASLTIPGANGPVTFAWGNAAPEAPSSVPEVIELQQDAAP